MQKSQFFGKTSPLKESPPIKKNSFLAHETAGRKRWGEWLGRVILLYVSFKPIVYSIQSLTGSENTFAIFIYNQSHKTEVLTKFSE